MKKNILGIVMAMVMLCSSSLVYANENISLPEADGVDYGSFEKTDKDTRLLMSKYNYDTSSFNIGVYINNGNSFQVNKNNSPYLKSATHSKTKDNNPDLYRVTYQAIYASSGKVRQGIQFIGPISGIDVKFSIEETDNFYFYISGDGTNNYTAKGTLYYGGI